MEKWQSELGTCWEVVADWIYMADSYKSDKEELTEDSSFQLLEIFGYVAENVGGLSSLWNETDDELEDTKKALKVVMSLYNERK